MKKFLKIASLSFATYYSAVNMHIHYHLKYSPDMDVPSPVWSSPTESKEAFRKHQDLVLATEDLLRGSLDMKRFDSYFTQDVVYSSNFLCLGGDYVPKYFLGVLGRKFGIEPFMEYHTTCGFCLLLKLDPGKEARVPPLYDTGLLFVSLDGDKVSGMTYQVNQKCHLKGDFKRYRLMGPQHDFVKSLNSLLLQSVLSILPFSAS